MPLQPATTSFCTALHRPYYYIGTAAIAVFTWSIAYCTNYFFTARNNPNMWVLFSVDTIINIVAVTVCVSAAMTFSCRAVRSRIIYGYQPPLSVSAYTTNWFKRILLFSLCMPTTWKRAILFVLNCLLVPAGLLVAILAGACEALKHSRADSRTDVTCRIDNVHGYVAFDATWRAVLIIAISTMNYLAAHHEGQKAFKGVPRQGEYTVVNEGEGDEQIVGVVVENERSSSPRNPRRGHRAAHALPIEMVSPREGPHDFTSLPSHLATQDQVVEGNEDVKQAPIPEHFDSQSLGDNNATFGQSNHN